MSSHDPYPYHSGPGQGLTPGPGVPGPGPDQRPGPGGPGHDQGPGSGSHPQYWSPGPSGRHGAPDGAPLGTPAGGPPDGRQVPRRRSGALLATALATLVVGAALGFGVGWLVLRDGDDAVQSSATDGTATEAADPAEPDATETTQADLAPGEADARFSCDIAGRMPEEIDLSEIGTLEDDPIWWHLGALQSLGSAAAVQDPTYDDLRDATDEMLTASRMFDGDGVNSALTSIRAECDALAF